MPRISEKRRVVNEILDVIEELALRMATGDTSDDSDDDANLLGDLIEFVDAIEGKRYMLPRTHMGHNDNLRSLMYDSDDKDFLECFRMHRVSFLQIVEMFTERWEVEVAGSKVVRGRKRRDFGMQLAVALCILGAEGGGSQRHRDNLGIGRGTIHLYVERVVEFLSGYAARYISWPSAEERRANASARTGKPFEKCVGVLDGSIIILRDSPKIDPESYFSRKHYGFNLQAVCDLEGRFILAAMGPTAAVDDSTALKQSPLYQKQEASFEAEEYVLVDEAYTLEQHFITPYKEPIARTPPFSTFNSKHAASCLKIEHAFAVLKARFPSLDSLPIRIGDDKEKGHQRVFKWTLACLVLHNLLHSINDNTDWLAESIRTRERNSQEVPPPPTQAEEKREGVLQRTKLLEAIMQRQTSHPGSAEQASGSAEGASRVERASGVERAKRRRITERASD